MRSPTQIYRSRTLNSGLYISGYETYISKSKTHPSLIYGVVSIGPPTWERDISVSPTHTVYPNPEHTYSDAGINIFRSRTQIPVTGTHTLYTDPQHIYPDPEHVYPDQQHIHSDPQHKNLKPPPHTSLKCAYAKLFSISRIYKVLAHRLISGLWKNLC